jgi:hypothetical protein
VVIVNKICRTRNLKLWCVAFKLWLLNPLIPTMYTRTTTLAVFLLSLVASGASAFSAVAPNRAGPVAKGAVDRTMQGIDAAGAFDPTAGENPALSRNNKDEVWVPQVGRRYCRGVSITLATSGS